jgi:hypothetical protein
MTTPIVGPVPANASASIQTRTATPMSIPIYRVNLMRLGYALMAVGLAATKWPLLPDAASLPVFGRRRRGPADGHVTARVPGPPDTRSR